VIGFELLRPALLALLVFAPLAFLLAWRARARTRAELAAWVAPRHRARFLPGFSDSRARLGALLGAAGLFFLALAALGPVRGYTFRPVSRKGLDLVVCLDTSRSMLAQDLRPSRLERAKREITGLLDHLAGDRVALIAFSGDARDVAPLTRDRQTLKGLLGFVTPDDNQEGGTDLAAAIEHALALFDGRTGAHEAIVLLTDGEDLEGNAMAQAEEAARRGIRLFVVGIGTEAGGKIPLLDAKGQSSFLKDEAGSEVVTKLGRESLSALAARTGGEFLSAEEAPTALEDLYRARIRRIQGREIESGERRVPYDRYQWPLALGLLCLILELGLGALRRRTREEPEGSLLVAALLPFLPLAQEPFSPSEALRDIVRHHRAGESEALEKAATTLLAHEGELTELERAKAHFSLGLLYATRARANPEEGDPLREKSRDEFSAARALAGPGDLRADATYDLGALELFHAESVRAKIPELGGQTLAPNSPSAPPGIPGLPPPAAADPLKDARALYEAARGWFVERLRLSWQDEDTRANLELIQRRLHELDELEKKREEQKQEQQDQNQDQDQQNQDQKDQDQKDKDQEDKDQQSQDQKDSQDKDNPKQDPKDEQDPQQPQDPKDQQPDEQPKPEDKGQAQKEQPEPAPEEQPKEGEEAQPQAAEPKDGEERVLTREEVMQLLDKLAELEKRQKALEAALRAKRRSAKRDW